MQELVDDGARISGEAAAGYMIAMATLAHAWAVLASTSEGNTSA